MEFPFAGAKSGIIIAPGSKSDALVWSQPCRDSHCVLGLHFPLTGPSIFSSIMQEAGIIVLAPDQPLVLARVHKKGIGAQKSVSMPSVPTPNGKGLGRRGSGRDTVLSDALISHGNCWEEAAPSGARSCSSPGRPHGS